MSKPVPTRNKRKPDTDALAGGVVLAGVLVVVAVASWAIWTIPDVATLGRFALTGGALILIGCAIGIVGEELR